MNFDTLIRHWPAGGDGTQLNAAALTLLLRSRAATHFAALRRSLILESLTWGALVLVLGNLLGAQRSFLALACHAYGVLMLAWSLRELVAAQSLHPAAPVAQLQQSLASLELLRLRRTRGALLGGLVLWAPFTLVFWQALTGLAVPAGPWLVANLVLGLVLTLLGCLYSPANAFWRTLAGQRISEAQAALADLERFAAQ